MLPFGIAATGTGMRLCRRTSQFALDTPFLNSTSTFNRRPVIIRHHVLKRYSLDVQNVYVVIVPSATDEFQ